MYYASLLLLLLLLFLNYDVTMTIERNAAMLRGLVTKTYVDVTLIANKRFYRLMV